MVSYADLQGMEMKTIGAAILIWLSFYGVACAAPPSAFGITMGTPISQLSVVRKVGENVFRVKAPIPHPEFENYSVLATPTHGVCKIVASGVTYSNDKYGTETRTAYNRIKSALAAKYGKSQTFDFIRSGSIWNGAHEWAASINQKERTLQDFWTTEVGSTLPEGMTGLDLDVGSTGLTDPYLIISYEFANFKSCRAADAQRSNRGL